MTYVVSCVNFSHVLLITACKVGSGYTAELILGSDVHVHKLVTWLHICLAIMD